MIAAFIRLLTGAQARWNDVAPLRDDGAIIRRIYFANHTSNLDAPVIWASLPKIVRRRTRPVAAKDYWDGSAIRRYLANKIFRAVLIERSRVTASTNPLVPMQAALDAGDSLIIFPEGTRSMNEDAGEPSAFKPGLWHLAKKYPDAELVPVRLENLNRVLPKGTLILIPLLAAVTFGKPISLNEGEAKDAFLERARQAIAQLDPEAGES